MLSYASAGSAHIHGDMLKREFPSLIPLYIKMHVTEFPTLNSAHPECRFTFQRRKMTSARIRIPIRMLMMMIQIGIPPRVSLDTWIVTC